MIYYFLDYIKMSHNGIRTNWIIIQIKKGWFVCPSYEINLPGLHQNAVVKANGQEFLLYVTPNGKRKSAIITSNDQGIARIKKMTFDCFQIEDIRIDFLNNKCSFTCYEQVGKKRASIIQYILQGFFIQYNDKSIAYFTYRKPKP